MDWSQWIVDAVMVGTGCLGVVFLAYGLGDLWEQHRDDEFPEVANGKQDLIRGKMPGVMNL